MEQVLPIFVRKSEQRILASSLMFIFLLSRILKFKDFGPEFAFQKCCHKLKWQHPTSSIMVQTFNRMYGQIWSVILWAYGGDFPPVCKFSISLKCVTDQKLQLPQGNGRRFRKICKSKALYVNITIQFSRNVQGDEGGFQFLTVQVDLRLSYIRTM